MNTVWSERSSPLDFLLLALRRPERDKTEDDIVDIEMPEIVSIAEAHNVHPAIICLKWAVQRGQIPIPFSVKKENYMNNLRAVIEDPLTEEEMEKIKVQIKIADL